MDLKRELQNLNNRLDKHRSKLAAAIAMLMQNMLEGGEIEGTGSDVESPKVWPWNRPAAVPVVPSKRPAAVRFRLRAQRPDHGARAASVCTPHGLQRAGGERVAVQDATGL